MANKLTKAQERMLRGYYTGSHARTSRNMTRTVKERLIDAGYLAPRSYSSHGMPLQIEITAKGLRAIHATADEIYARERLERERAVEFDRERERATLAADDRARERKKKIIAKVREEFLGKVFPDDVWLWNLITRIVEIHEGTA